MATQHQIGTCQVTARLCGGPFDGRLSKMTVPVSQHGHDFPWFLDMLPDGVPPVPIPVLPNIRWGRAVMLRYVFDEDLTEIRGSEHYVFYTFVPEGRI